MIFILFFMKSTLAEQLTDLLAKHGDQEFELYEEIQFQLNKWKHEQLDLAETPPHVKEIWRRWNLASDELKSKPLLDLNERPWLSHLGGIRKGEVICFAGRPKMGKSSTLLFLIRSLTPSNKTLLISPELNERYIIQRMLANQAQIPYAAIQQGDLNDDLFDQVVQAAENLFCQTLNIHSHYFHDVNEYAQFIEASIVRDKMEVICIDDIDCFGNKWDNGHYNEVNQLLRFIKKMAFQHQVSFVFTAPVHAMVEHDGSAEKKPHLHHLFPYHHVVDIADKVIFLYRAESYGITMDQWGNSTAHRIDWLVAKNNSDQPRALHFTCSSEFSDFTELAIPSKFLYPF